MSRHERFTNATGAPVEYADPGLALAGDPADHYDHRLVDDDWEQPGILFRKMNPAQRQALFGNTARAINGACNEVKERHVANCTQADPAYGRGIAEAIGISIREAELGSAK